MAARYLQPKQLLTVLSVLLLIVIFLSARYTVHHDGAEDLKSSSSWSGNEHGAVGDQYDGTDLEARPPSSDITEYDDNFEDIAIIPDTAAYYSVKEPGNEGDDYEEYYDEGPDEEEDEDPGTENEAYYYYNTTTENDQSKAEDSGIDYREIFSLTTRDRKFFSIYFDGIETYNPNLIPHPTEHDKWIAVARRGLSEVKNNEQLVCIVSFLGESLVCSEHPTLLPVAPSLEGVCVDELAHMNSCDHCAGPRDARMFWGPDTPYIIYGSQSHHVCLGIWLQDARMLLEPFDLERVTVNGSFQEAAELERPAPWKPQEKNFFLFWDREGNQYVHHDIWPNRVFTQLNSDGTVGEDLAPYAASNDKVCMAKYLPHVKGPPYESLHQATNSLSITLCKRTDPDCVPDDSNTFIIHLFHHKNKKDKSVYEPYVLLFHRTAPFAMHAISQRALWIHGRPTPEESFWDFLFVTSMSWKSHSQKYHGYIDDPLFLAFGITDRGTAAIDILAGDLLQDLAFC